MKRTLAVLTVLLMLPFAGTLARSQGQQDQNGQPPSLADVARQQRELRRQSPRNGETITTEVASALRPGSKLSIAGVRAPATPSPDTTAPAPSQTGEASSEASNPEQAWRARFADARTVITRLENQLQLRQEELSELNSQLLSRDDIYNRDGQLRPRITEKQGEISQTIEELAGASQALQQLQTELRQAGLPAGWAR